jgi:hypothetical protein
MHRGRPASIQGSISDDGSSKTTAHHRGARKILGLHNQPIVAEAIQALPKCRRNLPGAMSLVGTSRTCQHVRSMSAIEGKPDDICSA